MKSLSYSPPHGSTVHPSVTGLVSRWPLKRSEGPPPVPLSRPTALKRLSGTGCSSASRPSSLRRSTMKRESSLSSGVPLRTVELTTQRDGARDLVRDDGMGADPEGDAELGGEVRGEHVDGARGLRRG